MSVTTLPQGEPCSSEQPPDQETERTATPAGCWVGFAKDLFFSENCHMCIIHVQNSFLHLENHKAAINKWNSGENPCKSIVHAFTSVYSRVSLCLCISTVNSPCSSTLPGVVGSLFYSLSWVYISLLFFFPKMDHKKRT